MRTSQIIFRAKIWRSADMFSTQAENSMGERHELQSNKANYIHFNAGNQTQLIVHSTTTGQQSTAWRSDWQLVRQSRSGELRTQKLKSHLVRTQSLTVPSFKPGGGQYIALYATPTARAFFLAYVYPSSPFDCIFFSKKSPDFFLCWLRLTSVSV